MPAAALIVASAISAGSTIYMASRSSGAAQGAAAEQADAANHAADLQAKAAADALAFQKQQWATTQGQMAPWVSTGTNALGRLSHLMGLSAPSTATPTATAGLSTLGAAPTAKTPLPIIPGTTPPHAHGSDDP